MSRRYNPPMLFCRARRALSVGAFCAVLFAAHASSAQVTGWFTVHAGRVAGGDTADNGTSWGVSMAAFEGPKGWMGADVDFSHSGDFNRDLFQDSGLTTLMANVIVSPSWKKVQPFLLAGAGGIRVRGCTVDCVRTLSKTEFGLDAGAGLQYRLTSIVGVRGELRYFRILSQLEDLPRQYSGSFDFFRLTMGVILSWAEM